MSAGRKEDTISPEVMQDGALADELETTREVEYIEFELGDHVVYPHHGAGKVLKKEEMEMLGERREYLTIKILHNDMTVRVPTENAALARSEEHTSELQSRVDLVCRLLLEKKKRKGQ